MMSIPFGVYMEPLSKKPIAAILKGVDRAHNFQSMGVYSPLKKQRSYIYEGRQIMMMIKSMRRSFPGYAGTAAAVEIAELQGKLAELQAFAPAP